MGTNGARVRKQYQGTRGRAHKALRTGRLSHAVEIQADVRFSAGFQVGPALGDDGGGSDPPSTED